LGTSLQWVAEVFRDFPGQCSQVIEKKLVSLDRTFGAKVRELHQQLESLADVGGDRRPAGT